MQYIPRLEVCLGRKGVDLAGAGLDSTHRLESCVLETPKILLERGERLFHVRTQVFERLQPDMKPDDPMCVRRTVGRL